MKYCLIVLLFSIAGFSCKKVTESPSTLGLADITSYCPMKVGKVFIYRMDSSTVVRGNFQTSYYLAKDTVVNTFIDNQGRTCYTMIRYLSDTLGNPVQQNPQSYYIAYDKNKIEFVDANNRRYINLVNPISLFTAWSGIGDFDSVQINNTISYAGWQFQYTSINQPYTVIDSTFPNTITVLQDSAITGTLGATLYTDIYSTEVYAQGVGLIYKQITALSNQPPNGQTGSYYEDGSFMLELNLVSYK